MIDRKKVTKSSFYLQRNLELCVGSLRRVLESLWIGKSPQSKTFQEPISIPITSLVIYFYLRLVVDKQPCFVLEKVWGGRSSI